MKHFSWNSACFMASGLRLLIIENRSLLINKYNLVLRQCSLSEANYDSLLFSFCIIVGSELYYSLLERHAKSH